MKFIVYWVASSFVCIPGTTIGQDTGLTKGIQYRIEAGFSGGTAGSNPFWVRSNQYGEVPLEAGGFTLRAQLTKDYVIKPGSKWSYGYGLRAFVNAGQANQLQLTEAYIKLRYGAFEFYGGRRREIQGLVDTVLTAGSYIWSGNALPMPKVDIRIARYTPIFKNGLIAIRGNFAHGWFGTSDSVKNYFLHQKSFYVRVGKPDWRLKVHVGFNHQVQWGGTLLYQRYDRGVRITKFGTDLQTYWFVVSGKSLYSDRSLYNADTLTILNGQATAEGGNRVGNHLGTIDLGFEYETERTRWFLYRQSIYEAGALFYLANISDGLHGLSIQRKGISQGIQRILIEYLQTSSQGGPIAESRSTIGQIRGIENYFNNGRYVDGWVYQNKTIGAPFIMPLEYATGAPQTQYKSPHYLLYSRVNALTIGVKSHFGKVDLLTRASFSTNLGNYDFPVFYRQISLQQQIVLPIKDYNLSATIGYDSQGLLRSNLGGMFLISRSL